MTTEPLPAPIEPPIEPPEPTQTVEAATPVAASRVRPYLLAAAAGLLFIAAFPGYGLWPLAWVAFAPLMLAVRGGGLRRALWLGCVAGFVGMVAGFYWIAHMLQEFARLPAPVAWLGALITAAGQGGLFGVVALLAVWLQRRTGWGWAAVLAVVLPAADFTFPMVFPYYVGNTLFGVTWLMQSAELWGVVGLAALLGLSNGTVLDLWLARREGRPLPRRTLGVAACVVAGLTLYGMVRTRQVDAQVAGAEKLRVGLVQVNVGGFENVASRSGTLEKYRQATRQLHEAGAQLVVWPEGALRSAVRPGAQLSERVLGGVRQPILFGATRLGEESDGKRLPYNAAFLADAEGRVLGSYDKSKLLVLGEYLPLGDMFPQLYDWVPQASHWGRGSSREPLVWGDWRVGTYICYEDIIPRFVNGLMAPTGGRRPDLMVNITNDSWYGDTVEPTQHLALAAFRAVEHRRALVRSTNTGVSALIDPAGRVVARTGQKVEATLLGDVARMSGSTLYQLWGDWVGWLALVVLGWAMVRRRPARGAA